MATPPGRPDRDGIVTRVRRWQIWTLSWPLKGYLLGVIAVAVAVAVAVVARADIDGGDVAVYLGLLGCGIVTIESARTVHEVKGAISRDLQTVWYLAIAITLPYAFAFLAPVPLAAYRLWRVRQSFAYRRVFSNATISLAYGAASLAFHHAGPAAAAHGPGTGAHALAWTGLVACCGALAWLINNGLLLIAIRFAEPAARVQDVFGGRETIAYDLIELSLAVPLTLVVAISPGLMAFGLPSIALYRRYLLHAQIHTHTRIDSATGMLNARAWRHEADAEYHRAVRSGASLALLMIAVDGFESVIGTAGPDAADQVLSHVGATLAGALPGGGLIGRIGPEEFAIMLPAAGPGDARRVGERLRDGVAGEPVAIENDVPNAGFVFRLTVSIGVAAAGHPVSSLPELISGASVALAAAKATGRNKVCVMPPLTPDLGSAERI
jgi:diguanylate cyclase (GGDEF)-like protein